VDDTAFILLSRGELVTASKLIVSHFRRFGLSIHTGKEAKTKVRKRRPFTFQGLLTKIALCPSASSSSSLLGTFFVPELSGTVDITLQITQARRCSTPRPTGIPRQTIRHANISALKSLVLKKKKKGK
jgi:hypothetical protein